MTKFGSTNLVALGQESARVYSYQLQQREASSEVVTFDRSIMTMLLFHAGLVRVWVAVWQWQRWPGQIRGSFSLDLFCQHAAQDSSVLSVCYCFPSFLYLLYLPFFLFYVNLSFRRFRLFVRLLPLFFAGFKMSVNRLSVTDSLNINCYDK